MSKAKFAAAKELIEEHHYDEARTILRTINHPTAKKWLERLDQLAPIQPPSDHKITSEIRPRVVLSITMIIAAITVWLIVYLIQRDIIAAPDALTSLVAGGTALLLCGLLSSLLVFLVLILLAVLLLKKIRE